MRRLLTAIAALLLTAAAARAETIHVGYQKIGTLLVLKQQHRFEDALKSAGVSVEWTQFQSGPTLLEALNAGAIDVGYTGDSPPVFAQAGGVDLVYVASQPISGRDAGVLVHKDSAIRAVADLRDKRVAFTKGSSAHFNTVQILASAGLTIADVHPVYLQPADAKAAFRSGSVDAWTIWDPFFALAQADPDARTLTDATIAPSNAFLLARRAFATAHPDWTLTFLHGVNDAAQWAGEHQDQLAAVLTEATGVDLGAERVAAARGSYHFDLMTDTVVARQQQVADAFADLRIIPRRIDIRAAVWTPPKGVTQ